VSDWVGQGVYLELELDLVWVTVQEVYPVVGLVLEVHLDLKVNWYSLLT